MRNLVKVFAVLVALITIVSISSAKDKKGKQFEGTISFAVSFEGQVDAATRAQMPTGMKMSYKGVKTRMELISMASQVIVSNSETKESLILIDAMGQKFAIKTTKEDTEKALAEAPKPTITILEETKQIAGYNCKKAEVTDKEGNVSVVYFTEDIDYPNSNRNNEFSEIKGVMLEYTTKQGEITIKFTAKEVIKEKIKDASFEVPADYKVLTKEEVKAMFGGGE